MEVNKQFSKTSKIKNYKSLEFKNKFSKKINKIISKDILKLKEAPFRFGDSTNTNNIINYVHNLDYYKLGIIINENNYDFNVFLKDNEYYIDDIKLNVILNNDKLFMFYKELF